MAFCITVGTHGRLYPPIYQNTASSLQAMEEFERRAEVVDPRLWIRKGEDSGFQEADANDLCTADFKGQLKGYEGVTAQCHNCGNWSAHCITEWPFFTVCFLPLIPLATHKYKLVACPICHFKQDLSTRPDVQSQHPGAGPIQQGGQGYGPGGPGQGPPGQGQPGLQGPMGPQGGGVKPITGTYS